MNIKNWIYETMWNGQFTSSHLDLPPSTPQCMKKRCLNCTFKIQDNVHTLGVVASEERNKSTHVCVV
jgi:hypothetical protein